MIFDLDGTLVDSYEAIAASLNRARTAFDLPPLTCDAVRRNVGHGLEQLIADLVGPESVADGARIFREHYAEICSETTRRLPGVSAALDALARRGYRMTVASNKPARFGRRILDELGLLSRFAAVHGPDTVGRHKPDPAMLRACLRAMSLAPREAVYVGDMPLDVRSAFRAAVPVVLVAGGSSGRDELAATGQTVIDGLNELVLLLSPRGSEGDGPCQSSDAQGISEYGFRNWADPDGGQAP